MYRKSYNSEELYYEELKLAEERAKFHADCAARNIRTTEDAERAWTRIAVARAEVVSQEILELDMTLSNVVWAGGTGGAR